MTFFFKGGVAYKNKLSLGCVNRWQMLCFPKTQVIKEKVSHESGLIKLISSSILLFLDSARVALHATVKRDHSLSHIEPWCGTSVQPWAILVIHPLKPFKPAVSWLAAEITTLRKIYFTAYRSKRKKQKTVFTTACRLNSQVWEIICTYTDLTTISVWRQYASSELGKCFPLK